MTIPITLYNPDSPINTIQVKDIAGAIRAKGEELKNVIDHLESVRTSPTISLAETDFPTMKSVFLDGSGELPSGLYSKISDKNWVGSGNFDSLPNVFNESNVGDRVTVNNKSYELYKDGDNYVWCESSYFTPQFFYDFFEIPDNTDVVLSNRGANQVDVPLKVSKFQKYSNSLLPYIVTTKTSEIRTNTVYDFGEQFTFSATFLNISREYQDSTLEMIQTNHFSVLMYIKDEFENVKVGLCYDADYKLYFFDGVDKTDLAYTLVENNTYQVSIMVQGDIVKILINNSLVGTLTNNKIKNKQLYFAICSDLNFGQYSNGAVVFGEIQLFTQILTKEENIVLKTQPRTWNFTQGQSYMDFTIEEIINLKAYEKIAQIDFTVDEQTGYNLPKSDSTSLDNTDVLATSKAVKATFDKAYEASELAKTKETAFSKNTAFNKNKTDSYSGSDSDLLVSQKALSTGLSTRVEKVAISNTAYDKNSTIFGQYSSSNIDKAPIINGSQHMLIQQSAGDNFGSQIATNYDVVNPGIAIRTYNPTTSSEWSKIYHEKNKPTISELGAEPIITKKTGFNLEKSDSIQFSSSETLATSKSVYDLFKELTLNHCFYDIGDYWVTESEVLPSTKWKGTSWVKVENKMLMGAGGLYTNSGEAGNASATLSTNNMPKHRHQVDNHVHGQPTHQHATSSHNSGGNDTKFAVTNAGAHTNTNYWNFNSPGYSSLAGGDNTYGAAPYTDYQGSGTAFSVLNPFRAVYFWRRIA
jgi:hypothetical protein